MLRKILWILLIVIVAFAGVVSVQPANYRISRTAVINVPAAKIFPHVNNLQKFNGWSPWAKIDPNATIVFEGSKEGVGAIMRWDGNSDVGKGIMTNIETRKNELARFKMEFLEPMTATSTAEFTLVPDGKQTTVTWTMYGTNNFIGKAVNLVFDCNGMVGGQFEKGLENLKTLVESK
jgi:hypothetical protein